MSPLARYEFLSFVRRGASAELKNEDPLAGALPYRGKLEAALKIESRDHGGPPASEEVKTKVQLDGPGDVLGIDPRHVIRTDPRDGTTNFEPNYFASIEFDHPDFLWLFTPAAAAPAATGDPPARLRPWLSLIVLMQDEFEEVERAPDPLSAIKVKAATSLPNLDESWAWAHAQIAGVGAGDLGAIVANEPERTLSRLICPRRLEGTKHYTAFLVPAFEFGVKAGLGQAVPSPADLAAADALTTAPAWTSASTDLELPVYYRFEFHTTEGGDFESLVRALQPRMLPKEVGMRPMVVDSPGWGGVRSAGPPLGLGGALRSLSTQDTPWSNPGKANFQADVSAAVNRGAVPLDDPAQDPRIVPPLYGRWHAARATVDPSKAGWLHALNTDPRPRSMAGFGTRVVLDQRSQLMTSAWAQVEGIEQANQLLRQAQLAREVSTQVHEKHLAPAGPATLLQLTGPVQKRVLASPRTVHATVAASRLPAGALSPAFRRIVRPLGPLRRRQGADPARAGRLVERLNRGDIEVVPRVPPLGGLVSHDSVCEDLYPSWLPTFMRPLLAWPRWLVIAFAIAIVAVFFVIGLVTGSVVIWLAVGVVVALLLLLASLGRRPPPERLRAARVLCADDIDPDVFTDAPPANDFHLNRPGDPEPEDAPPGRDSPDAAAFRDAARRVLDGFTLTKDDPPDLDPLDLPALEATLLENLDPATTIPARVAELIEIDPDLGWEPDDPLDEIMAAPEFPQPMYEPLRDLSQDHLLPGLDAVDPNTLGLLKENHAFIEAYLVGANHEMARQLLWNRYPTDQRGSYFRQFWDVRGYVPRAGDPPDEKALREKLKDIPQVHRWGRNNRLGSNRNRTDVQPDNLILLLRGDLIRRYPNALVYACEAKRDATTGKRTLGQAESYPLFRGTLSPDVTFFGFALDATKARGSTDPAKPQGWYFVFQELPSEARFGLDAEQDQAPVVTAWTQLSWSNFDASAKFAPATTQPTSVNVTATPDKDYAWGADSAEMAYITMRRPTRIAVHADTMIPSGVA